MKTIIVIIVILMNCADSQYPDCADVTCPDGSVPLSPLSYNTMRSNVFNGTQPSNEGCTNGVSIDRQVTIDCRQGTTLIDCDQGYNDNADYSDLSNYFIWNRTTSVAQQVSMVFRFYQQIRISRISLFFWNSPTDNITIPTVTMSRSDYSYDDTIDFNDIRTINTNSLNRASDGRHILNFDVNNPRLQFQYLIIKMKFYNNSEWIFLSEVQFCGNRAPYHITQPSTDYDVQIVSSAATMANLTCSLNVTIPKSMVVSWIHNVDNPIPVTETIQTGNTTALLIENLLPSDAGIYQCVFYDDDTDGGSGWILRRNIRLLITVVFTTTDTSSTAIVTVTTVTTANTTSATTSKITTTATTSSSSNFRIDIATASTATASTATASIATASITTASIATASIATASIATASIATASIVTASIPTASIPTASIATASIATTSIATASIPTASIATANIATASTATASTATASIASIAITTTAAADNSTMLSTDTYISTATTELLSLIAPSPTLQSDNSLTNSLSLRVIVGIVILVVVMFIIITVVVVEIIMH